MVAMSVGRRMNRKESVTKNNKKKKIKKSNAMRHVQIKIMFILPIIDGKKAHRNNCMKDVRLLYMSEK